MPRVGNDRDTIWSFRKAAHLPVHPPNTGTGPKGGRSCGGSLSATPKRAPGHVVHLSLIVPDFHVLNRPAAQHLMGTLARLIHIRSPDKLAGHEFAQSAEAEKSVCDHRDSRGTSPDDNGRC